MKRDLTSLVSSRICHDLISPIGAISNGVELMTELTGSTSPELGLIADSVDSASGKVRYFRIAFGAAKPDAQVSVSELRGAISAMFTGRNKAVLEVEEANLPRQTSKMLLLALLCLEKSLPLGGGITIIATAEGFGITVEAERFAQAPEKWDLLIHDTGAEVSASDVQFLLLREELEKTGTRLDHHFGEGSASMQMEGLRPAA